MKPIIFIPLSDGQNAFIDFEDFDKQTRWGTVREHKWRVGTDNYPTTYRNRKPVFLHNFVLDRDPNPKVHLHHKDENKMNATKDNLEELSCSTHRLKHRVNPYNYMGTSWDVNKTRVIFHGKVIARVHSQELAALIWDRAMFNAHSGTVPLNFPSFSAEQRQARIMELLKLEANFH